MNRIEEAPDDTAAFDSKTGSIPGEIAGTEAEQSAAVPVAAPVDPRAQYLWTPEEVGEQFGALFLVGEMFRGPHWAVDADGLSRLGQKFCPIFCRYVPNTGTTVPWIGDAMMWLGALGALKDVAGPALKEEIRLAKLAKQKQQGRVSSPVSTKMGTSVEASESSENEAPENQRSWSAS